MRLYVTCPAFGLPSLDPECIAATALLQAHNEDNASWSLIPTFEDGKTRLPMLVDGQGQYHGFSNIARYLSAILSTPNEQTATSIALNSFIEANGLTLLDISLYVSFANYRTATRAAYTSTLPWYANYTIPPRRRAAARERREHLGVSSLDIDSVHEDVIDKPTSQQNPPAFDTETEKRAKTLFGRRETVRSMLQRPEYAGAFRLKGLADAFFEPLEAQLGENEYLLGTEEPASLDYMAYGYLSLMLYPQLPQAWLQDRLRKRYPRLVSYTERMTSKLGWRIDDRPATALSESANLDDARLSDGLPWAMPERRSIVSIATFLGHDLVRRMPALGFEDTLIRDEKPAGVVSRYLPVVSGLITVLLAGTGYWAYINALWPRGDAVQVFGRKRLADYGEAGAALAALGGQARRETAYQQQQEQDATVNVDVVVDGPIEG